MTDEPRVLLEDFEIYEPIEEVDAWTDFKPLEMVTSVDDNKPLEESRNNNGGSGKPSPLSLTKGN